MSKRKPKDLAKEAAEASIAMTAIRRRPNLTGQLQAAINRRQNDSLAERVRELKKAGLPPETLLDFLWADVAKKTDECSVVEAHLVVEPDESATTTFRGQTHDYRVPGLVAICGLFQTDPDTTACIVPVDEAAPVAPCNCVLNR